MGVLKLPTASAADVWHRSPGLKSEPALPFPCTPLSSDFFRTPPKGFVEILPVKKVGLLSKYLLFGYVNQVTRFCGKYLWRTPVDNSVEIVEKSWFSTGIPVF